MTPEQAFPYPKTVNEVTAEALSKHFLAYANACNAHASSEAAAGAPLAAVAGTLRTVVDQTCIGLLLIELKALSLERADIVAREMWELCDYGDSFGEVLYELLQKYGVDPDTIRFEQKVDDV